MYRTFFNSLSKTTLLKYLGRPVKTETVVVLKFGGDLLQYYVYNRGRTRTGFPGQGGVKGLVTLVTLPPDTPVDERWVTLQTFTKPRGCESIDIRIYFCRTPRGVRDLTSGRQTGRKEDPGTKKDEQVTRPHTHTGCTPVVPG